VSNRRLAGTVGAVCLNLAAGLVLLRVLEEVALPAILRLLVAYGWVG
jgi:hypothetical protein